MVVWCISVYVFSFQTFILKGLNNDLTAWWWVRLGSGYYQMTAWTAKCTCCK